MVLFYGRSVKIETWVEEIPHAEAQSPQRNTKEKRKGGKVR